MTMAWSLPTPYPTRTSHRVLRIPRLRLELTRVVVPTFRDWEHARETIDGLLTCSPRPAEIVLVDDNAEHDPPRWTSHPGITLINYDGNRGPSFARNAGAFLRTERPIEWLYFTDTGCGRAPWFFAALVDAMSRAPESAVACAGPVYGVIDTPSATPINHYMTVQGILNPPMDASGPQAIVTANALVHAGCFAELGGFDRSYPFAAGEDIDLGVKLRRLGPIAWAPAAVVYHRFEECEENFRRRFERYGHGTAHLEHRLRLPSIRPAPILLADPTLQRLANLQATSMRAGYDRHKTILHQHRAFARSL